MCARGGGARAGLTMPTLDIARAGPPLHAGPVLKCNKTYRNRQVKARHDSCGKCNRHKAFFDIVGLALRTISLIPTKRFCRCELPLKK